MNKIASVTLDVVDHIINDDLEKLASVIENLSDEAKTAYIPSVEELADRDDKDFAVILWHPTIGTFRKYAKFDKGLTEINLAILAEQADSIPTEIMKVAATNLTCAANNYNIPIPEKLAEYNSSKYIQNILDVRTISNSTKQEEEEEVKTAFALPEQKKYPIDTPSNIKKASSFFEKNHNKMNPLEKYEFAKNVKIAADTISVGIEKTAVHTYGNLDNSKFNEDLYYNVQVRKSYLKDLEEELKTSYDELLRRCDELGPVKTAAVLYELDKESKLIGNYGKGLLDPVISTFSLNKIAGREIDDTFVTQQQLNNLDSGELTVLVGNDVIPELKGEHGLDVFASLPKPIRQEIFQLM